MRRWARIGQNRGVPAEEKPKPIPGSVATVRILGVPVRLHFTFVLLLVFLVFIGVGQRQSGVSTAVYVLALFASVLLHELGHALVARRYGIVTIEIVMFPIGGVSRPERAPKANEELWIGTSPHDSAVANMFNDLLKSARLWQILDSLQ